MKRIISSGLLIFFLTFSKPAKCDLFGGDIVVLSQILVQTIQQLYQLKQILSTGRDSLNLVQEINRGINDSLRMIKTSGLNIDPGLYKDWRNVNEAIRNLQKIYGLVMESREAPIQRDADEAVAEAVTLNNSIYSYTKDIDAIGEEIKQYSHMVSPGGAQKLTAQAMGVMLNVMNQSLRTQATGLKLQAQMLAIENRKDKEQTKHILETTRSLQSAMSTRPIKFETPRF